MSLDQNSLLDCLFAYVNDLSVVPLISINTSIITSVLKTLSIDSLIIVRCAIMPGFAIPPPTKRDFYKYV